MFAIPVPSGSFCDPSLIFSWSTSIKILIPSASSDRSITSVDSKTPRMVFPLALMHSTVHIPGWSFSSTILNPSTSPADAMALTSEPMWWS